MRHWTGLEGKQIKTWVFSLSLRVLREAHGDGGHGGGMDAFSCCLNATPPSPTPVGSPVHPFYVNSALTWSSSAQSFWHRVSWKTIFPQTGVRSGLGMIQVHYIYCTLHFYYYYIDSASNHQALDLGGWGPLTYSISPSFPCRCSSSMCRGLDSPRLPSDHFELGRVNNRLHHSPSNGS